MNLLSGRALKPGKLDLNVVEEIENLRTFDILLVWLVVLFLKALQKHLFISKDASNTMNRTKHSFESIWMSCKMNWNQTASLYFSNR